MERPEAINILKIYLKHNRPHLPAQVVRATEFAIKDMEERQLALSLIVQQPGIKQPMASGKGT